MIVALVAIAIAQQGTYFGRTFPVPTGNNGWEEYTMALDLLSGKGVRQIDRNLEAARAVVAGCSRVYELVRTGNQKPLSYPWLIDPVEFDEREPGPNLADVGFALTFRVGVLAADGRPAAAVDALMDALTFADRISYPTQINTLIALVTFNLSFRELSALLPKLDDASARELSLTFGRLADGPQPLVQTYLNDIDLESAYLAKWFDEPADHHDSEYWDVPEGFLSLTFDEKTRYVSLIRAEFAKYKEQIRAMVSREERFWSFEPPLHTDPIVNYAFEYFTTSLATRIAVRTRTQHRLAAIQCRIIEFKRNHNRWPDKLEELGGREVWYDPASGGPFFYAKLTEQSYTLYSLGTPETGRIDLVYRPEFRTSGGLPNNRHVPRNARAGGLEWNRRY